MSPVHGRGKRGNKDDPIPLRLLGNSLAWRSVPLTVHIFFNVPIASKQRKCYDTWTTPINSLPARRRSYQYRRVRGRNLSLRFLRWNTKSSSWIRQ